MRLSTSAAVAAVGIAAAALSVAAAPVAAPEPAPGYGGYGKNLKNARHNNAAVKKNANAAAKNSKYDNHVAVNQGFAYNQVKKDTHAKANAAKKNFDHAAIKNTQKKSNYNNFGYPGYKGKGYGVW